MQQLRKIFLTAILLPVAALAYKTEVGYDQLLQELGSAMPTGSGVKVTQVEASDGNGNYAPNLSSSQFSGKIINLRSGSSGSSSHATGVGSLFYGNTNSMAPGVTVIDSYEANNWVGPGFLRVGSNPAADPLIEDSRVQNHSWIASASTESGAIEAVRRLDFAINRDGFIAVAGLGNGTGQVPDLLGHAYNTITVGRSDGNHSRNGTRFDQAGRLKPDIVAPQGTTSGATPVVASAAAMLLEVADNSSELVNARHNPQVMKSVLMAGATKEPFAQWGRTSEEPIDPVYGSGQVNVYNSYRILTGGQHAASLNTLVPSHSGWDFANTQSTDLFYFFDFDQPLEKFTANLTWHRQFTSSPGPSNFVNRNAILAEIHLTLYEVDGFTLGNPVQSSISDLDNLQHIYLNTLSAGRYALGIDVVSNPAGGTDYGLAWDAVVIPEPRFAALLLAVATVLLLLRRQRSPAV